MPELNAQLPNGAGNHIDATNDFKAKVEESKIKIQSETLPPPGKRPVGRPPKLKVSETVAPPNASVHAVQSFGPGAPPPDISKHLILPLMGASRIPAASFGIPEIALSMEEAVLCAGACNDLLNAFSPTVGVMSPKTAAVFAAASVFGSIGFSKYIEYSSRIQKPAPKVDVNASEQISQPFPVQKGGDVNAAEYFKKAAV